MLQYLLLIFCPEYTFSSCDLHLYPTVLYNPEDKRSKVEINSEYTHKNETLEEKFENYYFLSRFSSYNFNLYLQYNNMENDVINLDVNNLQRLTDYKLLNKKLYDLNTTWDLEDNNKNIQCYFLKYINIKEIENIKKPKRYIHYTLNSFCESMNKYINIIKTKALNMPQDEYTGDINEQLDFFINVLYSINKYTFSRYLTFRYDGPKIIDFYSSLIIRLNFLEKEFLLVDRFEMFKIFFEWKYLTDFNEDKKLLIQNALKKISQNLNNVFTKADKLCGWCFEIISNMERAIYNNEQKINIFHKKKLEY
ncbi:putative SP-containing protein [Vairimorpha necatrix]|uniref:SP-containing protein n=1 Tax=Vairimorpha necatrix TaxID=6039 RepID=A0AAX4JG38_9MICR